LFRETGLQQDYVILVYSGVTDHGPALHECLSRYIISSSLVEIIPNIEMEAIMPNILQEKKTEQD
jgi:hypothetical protein